MKLTASQAGLIGLLALSFASCGGGKSGISPLTQINGENQNRNNGLQEGEMVTVQEISDPDTPSSARVASALTFQRTGANSGGATTLSIFDQDAFNRPAANLSPAERQRHGAGKAIFDRPFNPAGAPNSPGLGPIFNGPACNSCHIRDGRGSQPPPGQPLRTMLLRVSVPGTDTNGGPKAAPGFGGQLQDKAIARVRPEASVNIVQSILPGAFLDGLPFNLEKPTFNITNPYTPLPPGFMTSPRVSPHMAGLGLLEAIPESTILAMADENDANKDGISGRPNRVWDEVAKRMTIGRFGWKSGAPNLLQQSAAAFRNDMGITNQLFPTEEAAGQLQDDRLKDDPEISAAVLDLIAFYSATEAVPARRNINDPKVLKGEELFHAAKCAACHTPIIKTGVHSTPKLTAQAPSGIPALNNQTIQPFTDLLLHDMGPGLSDNRPDGVATGQEWRTPPLWGIGLFQVTNGHTRYLHDGRARNLSEAILWHGGEGEASKKSYIAMSATDRANLLAFLNSL